MQTGFQLGLELTTLVGAIAKGAFRLGTTLQEQESIRRSGSDDLTEHKLAYFVGRHMIHDAFAKGFKDIVVKNTKITHLVKDLVLEVGAGPTVARAMRLSASGNQAFLSLAVQASFLTSFIQNEALAFALTQTIENVLQSANSPGQGVDYASVLDVLHTCQQQTAAFPWHHYQAAVESKLCLNGHSQQDSAICADHADNINAPMPYAVLSGLLYYLDYVQRFPDQYTLTISSPQGACGVVIWCSYVLGIGTMVCFGNKEILFGDSPFNITLIVTGETPPSVTLLEKKSPLDPLFTITATDSDPELTAERTLPLWGYAKVFNERLGDHGTAYAYARTRCGQQRGSLSEDSQRQILTVVRILFAIEENLVIPIPEDSDSRGLNPDLCSLVEILGQVEDLQNCVDVPFYPAQSFMSHKIEDGFKDLENTTFDSLLRYFLGGYSGSRLQPPALVSARGWSIFVGTLHPSTPHPDPSDETTGRVHIKLGVPARYGVRFSRIFDSGPPTDDIAVLEDLVKRNRVESWPDTWTPRELNIFVGFQSRDFLLVQQEFSRGNASHSKIKLGFRWMYNATVNTQLLEPCDHTSPASMGSLDIPQDSPLELLWPPSNSSPSLKNPHIRIYHVKNTKIFLFLVAEIGDARFVFLSQLTYALYDDMRPGILRKRHDVDPFIPIWVRPPSCCLQCAASRFVTLPPFTDKAFILL